MSATQSDELAIYRVYVAKQMYGRQRKHTVLQYMTVTKSVQDAVENMRKHLEDQPGHEIVGCSRFSGLDTVLLATAFALTPVELEKMRKRFAEQISQESAQ